MSNIQASIEELESLLIKSKNVCLVSHTKPDGDSIGSVLSFGLALMKRFECNFNLLFPEGIPEKYMFMPGSNLITYNLDYKSIDLLICLDCSDEFRLGHVKKLIEKSTHVINIDHHISNNRFGSINIVDFNASSTGEIIYNIVEELKIEIDKDIATSLYVAISTDTGSFMYDNTSSKTYMIASNLMNKNIDLNKIVTEIYQNRSINKTKLFIETLKTLELFLNDKVAIVCVTNEMLKNTNSAVNDIDGIVEFIRDIETVEIACIIREVNNHESKVGLRSKRYVDVANIAKGFNGGGHKKASGCTIYNNIIDSKKQILIEIEKVIR